MKYRVLLCFALGSYDTRYGALEVGVADSGYQEQGKDYIIKAALNTGI